MAVKVIDISYCQTKVDFQKIKNQGIKAVIIRTGYLNKTDTMFHKHMKGAIEAGLDIGVYTYITATRTAELIKEAEQTVERLEQYKGYITYPVYVDMENEKYLDERKYNDGSRTNFITQFCEIIREAGYYPGVYINPSWLEEWTTKSRIVGKYDIWLAAWTEDPKKPTRYNYGQKMWQWGKYGKGKLSGINKNEECDGDLCYVDYPAIIRKAGLNFLKEKPAGNEVTITATKIVPVSQVAQYAGKLQGMGFEVTVK